jgi:hypothetical protein
MLLGAWRVAPPRWPFDRRLRRLGLAGFDALPEIFRDDVKIRNLDAEPVLLAAWPSDPLSRLRVPQFARAVPETRAPIELIVQNPGSA